MANIGIAGLAAAGGLLLIFAAVIVGGGVLVALLMNYAKSREAAEYNGGFCTECPNSPMVRFDTDSQGGRGYRCDECQRRIWISYRVDK